MGMVEIFLQFVFRLKSKLVENFELIKQYLVIRRVTLYFDKKLRLSRHSCNPLVFQNYSYSAGTNLQAHVC